MKSLVVKFLLKSGTITASYHNSRVLVKQDATISSVSDGSSVPSFEPTSV